MIKRILLPLLLLAETKQDLVSHLSECEEVSEKFELFHCYDNNRKIRN